VQQQNSTNRRDEVRQAVATVIGLDAADIGDDANLVQLGLTSLQLMRLVNDWRRNGNRVRFGDLAAVPTVTAWSDHLAGADPVATP
jgi:aryl carrier-like protein